MDAQERSTHRSRKPRWVVIVLAIISTLAAITSIAIGCSFFVAVGLNLEGPFRLKFFWFPMPWWLFEAIGLIDVGNSVCLLGFLILQVRKELRASRKQKKSVMLLSTPRWLLVWCMIVLLSVASNSLYPLDMQGTFVQKGKTDLLSVAMVSATEGWAVGNFQGEQPGGVPYGVIWQYSDGKWTQAVQLANEFLTGVTALPDGEAWAVGEDNTILHEWKGEWTLVHSNVPTENFAVLSKVAMVSSTEGWAVGNFQGKHPEDVRYGVIWQYSHKEWTEAFRFAKADLWNISTLPNGEAWAVGSEGVILHEQGGTWSQVASPTQQELDSIAMVSSTEGWALGGRTLLHYHNGKWTLFPLTSTNSLSSIIMTSSSEGWIIASNGNILHYTQGIWQRVHSPSSQILRSIALVPGSSSGSWIVGEGPLADTNTIPSPTILRMQNGSWNAYQP